MRSSLGLSIVTSKLGVSSLNLRVVVASNLVGSPETEEETSEDVGTPVNCNIKA